MNKKAWAVWKGSVKNGGGTISTETGVLKNAPYGFNARYEITASHLTGTYHDGCEAVGMTSSFNRSWSYVRQRTVEGLLNRHIESSHNQWRQQLQVVIVLAIKELRARKITG